MLHRTTRASESFGVNLSEYRQPILDRRVDSERRKVPKNVEMYTTNLFKNLRFLNRIISKISFN
jgi:hypothetical protein